MQGLPGLLGPPAGHRLLGALDRTGALIDQGPPAPDKQIKNNQAFRTKKEYLQRFHLMTRRETTDGKQQTRDNRRKQQMERVMIELKSVSTGIALDGMCYPMFAQEWNVESQSWEGKYDYKAGIYILETSEDKEWRNALSEEDRKVVNTVIHMLGKQ